jgi:hypothetical protein
MSAAIETGNESRLRALLEAQDYVPDDQKADLIDVAVRTHQIALAWLILGESPEPALVGKVLVNIMAWVARTAQIDPFRASLIDEARRVVQQHRLLLPRDDLARALRIAVRTGDLALVQSILVPLRPLDMRILENGLRHAWSGLHLHIIRALLEEGLGRLSQDLQVYYFAVNGMIEELFAAETDSGAAWDVVLMLLCLVGNPRHIIAFFREIKEDSVSSTAVMAALRAACISGSATTVRIIAQTYPGQVLPPNTPLPPIMIWDPTASIPSELLPLVQPMIDAYRRKCGELISSVGSSLVVLNM